MERVIRWGILGCGDVTENKSGPAFSRARGSALVAVMRRDARLAEDYARRHGVARWYARAEDLARDPEVDAIYVAAPPNAHEPLATIAAEAGKPALVEKPMARSHAECARMNAAFAKAGLPLYVAYYRRALPRFLKLRGLLAEGRVGKPVSLAYRYVRDSRRSVGASPWRLDAEIAGGGLLLDVGCHALDVFDWLFGALGDVSGSAARAAAGAGVEDVVAMRFTTASGVVGAASWDFAGVGPHVDRLEIGGTEGAIELAVFGDGPIRIAGPDGAVESVAIPNPKHIAEPLVQSVVDALRGQGVCESTGESAARTSRVMDEVLAGFYGGRDGTYWERAGR
jgi:predicted dehydrogenase